MTTSIPPNFRPVPGVPYFAVSERGEAINLRTGKIATPSKQKTGYRTVALAVDGKTKTFYLHRLVAMAFIPVPEEVSEQTDKPEVNHIDGNKDNNAKSNLEWVTSKQNKKHAIDNDLFKFKKVACKNLITGEVVIEPNYHSCARKFNIGEKRLRRHLNSNMAGLITKDYWVFKYNDDTPWPDIDNDCIIENRWDNHKGIWVAEKDGKRYLGDVLANLCEQLGVKYYTVQPEVRADGEKYRVVGYDFWYCNLPTKQMLSEVVFTEKEPVFKTPRALKCTHLKLQVSRIYPSLRAASGALGIADTTLLYAITKKNGYHGEYRIEYVDK